MIITFILVIALALGIIVRRKCSDELIVIIGFFLSVLSSFVLFVLLIGTIIVYATANKTIQESKMYYDGLCKRYEIVKSEYEDVSKSDVIVDITRWNQEVYNIKYWTESLWTNWFNPKSIADNLEYIPLE